MALRPFNAHRTFRTCRATCLKWWRTNANNDDKEDILKLENSISLKTGNESMKDFKCESCDRTFTRKIGLKLHVDIVHKGIAKITCKICNMIFQTNSKLKAHIEAVHEKIKKYKCDQCFSKFAASYNLRQHIATVHEGRFQQFQCPSCSKGFRRRPLLNQHLENEHGSKTT